MKSRLYLASRNFRNKVQVLEFFHVLHMLYNNKLNEVNPPCAMTKSLN